MALPTNRQNTTTKREIVSKNTNDGGVSAVKRTEANIHDEVSVAKIDTGIEKSTTKLGKQEEKREREKRFDASGESAQFKDVNYDAPAASSPQKNFNSFGLKLDDFLPLEERLSHFYQRLRNRLLTRSVDFDIENHDILGDRYANVSDRCDSEETHNGLVSLHLRKPAHIDYLKEVDYNPPVEPCPRGIKSIRLGQTMGRLIQVLVLLTLAQLVQPVPVTFKEGYDINWCSDAMTTTSATTPTTTKTSESSETRAPSTPELWPLIVTDVILLMMLDMVLMTMLASVISLITFGGFWCILKLVEECRSRCSDVSHTASDECESDECESEITQTIEATPEHAQGRPSSSAVRGGRTTNVTSLFADGASRSDIYGNVEVKQFKQFEKAKCPDCRVSYEAYVIGKGKKKCQEHALEGDNSCFR